jgi:uncharacterized SAM-binding protein YcdF (DUF218 family)
MSERAATDAVIVLGAAVAGPGIPGPAMLRRTTHGVRVFADRDARCLVLSGGQVGPPPAEAAVMRGIARGLGVPDQRIILEDRSRNTFENALYCGLIMRERAWSRVVVVTDSFHLPRALYIFRAIGLKVEGSGAPRGSSTSRLAWARLHAEEALRCVNCAYHFAVGTHKPKLTQVWGEVGQG